MAADLGQNAETREPGRAGSPALRPLLRPLLRRGPTISLDIIVPAVVLTAIVVACFIVPAVFPLHPPTGGTPLNANLPIWSAGHLLGTDMNGNDVLARLLHGGRTSLSIAIAVNLAGLVVGGLLGIFSAYVRGVIDSVIMRLVDVLVAFPSLVLVLVVAWSLGQSPVNTVAALTVLSIPAFARIARAATLRLRDQPFILAAGLSGTGALAVMVRHIVPNVLPQLVSFALLGMGIVIILEGALSYLGLGIPAPAPSWGGMIAQGQHVLAVRPGLLLLPGTLLFVTVLACNLLGEALRERWGRR